MTSLLIIMASTICYFFVEFIGFRAVALILLLVVSIIATLFEVFPVLLAALLSALIWNYFFIPPLKTFHIGNAEDGLMFLMYFVIASINAVLTNKIKGLESQAREKAEGEKAIKLYNTLLNSLSHELKTPISTIIGALDIIKENPGKITPSEIKELHLEMEIAALRLNGQVNNLLSMSRLDAGYIKPKLDWVDLNELIYESMGAVDIGSHTIHFESNEDLPLIYTDGGLLTQCFINLIQNAVTHTPDESEISINATYQSDSARVIVSDNGGGFPEDLIPLVFEKFYKVNKTSTGGTGLGLSIVKGFLDALGGKITLENNNDRGAKFTINLPCKSTPKAMKEYE